ncbi:hypothetical protein E0E50_05880 [Azotobacter chroococcum subsp. isscasi]|uniref:hypothetical protein n=1 Tax=Azotobacter chroococcum TaxID=353 RepID=UPI00103A0E71|nr:hypothetical protein [Azotobacter chroococcum]TBW11699.1 hypothetical protein E0E50_05880 [Azotobacter chroococcum subsp. isscasi]
MKKSRPLSQQASPSQGQHITAPTLIAAVLKHMLFTSSLNKYEAARELGDWSLHSTISDLANTYGLTIKRTPEKVPASRMPVTRYSIPDNERARARAVLALLSKPAKGRKGAAA